jgi:hypothetical protein
MIVTELIYVFEPFAFVEVNVMVWIPGALKVTLIGPTVEAEDGEAFDPKFQDHEVGEFVDASVKVKA